MKAGDKASLLLTSIFMVLLLSLVWMSNEQYGIKLKISLSLVLSVGIMAGTILAVLRWTESNVLAHTAGLVVFTLGYIFSGYLVLGKVDVTTTVAGITIGLLLILLERWEEGKDRRTALPADAR
ncbi:hypothetical protein [Thermococcus sp.]|uniref:hypothetical protein n=1 Tax=Thermococcus sp. TaxID=35749 RepID=UPI002605D05E|nr:hypothetical protein [Thermococcus sp.]